MDLSKRIGLALILSSIAIACAAPAIPGQLGNDDEEEEEEQSESASNKKKTTPSKKTTPKSPAPSAPADSAADPGADPLPPNNDPGTPPPPPPPAGGQCSQQQDPEACFMCCDDVSQGALAQADEAFGACACEGQCASACGNNWCNGGQESAACGQCLQQTCEPAFESACSGAACKAGLACLQSSCDPGQ